MAKITRSFTTLTGKESEEELLEIKLLTEADVYKETRLNLSVDAIMNKEFVEKVSKLFKDSDFKILVDISEQDVQNRGCVFNDKETKTLKEHTDILKISGLESELLDDFTKETYKIDDVIEANQKISVWAKNINSAKVDGRPLSPFEKFIFAHNFIALTKKFNEENKNESPTESRHIVKVAKGDKIVCAGYANLLCALCKQIDIPCVNQSVLFGDGGHAVCNVYIKDDLYNIDDMYLSDPTNFGNFAALIRHSDYPELVQAISKKEIQYLAKESFLDVNSDKLSFFNNTSEEFKERHNEYGEYLKNRNELEEELEKNDVSGQILNTQKSEMLDDMLAEEMEKYIKNLCFVNASKEERIAFLEQSALKTAYGYSDTTLLFDRIETILESAHEEKAFFDDDFNLFHYAASKLDKHVTLDFNGVKAYSKLVEGDEHEHLSIIENEKLKNLKAQLIAMETIEKAVSAYRKAFSLTGDKKAADIKNTQSDLSALQQIISDRLAYLNNEKNLSNASREDFEYIFFNNIDKENPSFEMFQDIEQYLSDYFAEKENSTDKQPKIEQIEIQEKEITPDEYDFGPSQTKEASKENEDVSTHETESEELQETENIEIQEPEIDTEYDYGTNQTEEIKTDEKELILNLKKPNN